MMDTEVIEAVKKFFERYPYASELGRLTTSTEFGKLSSRFKSLIPNWYKDLLLQYPIAGLPLGVPNDFGQLVFKGKPIEQLPLMEISFYTIDEMEKATQSLFPNHLLVKHKIIAIGEDKFSTQEGVFIDTKQVNPPVMMIFHDMGETIEELLESGEQITKSFTDLFNYGKLTNDKIKLTDENRNQALEQIKDFFSFIDHEILGKEDLKKILEEPKRLTDSIAQRNAMIEKEGYISAFLNLEHGLYDSGYPLTKTHLDKLTAIYKVCNLHIPELQFIEERVNNSMG